MNLKGAKPGDRFICEFEVINDCNHDGAVKAIPITMLGKGPINYISYFYEDVEVSSFTFKPIELELGMIIYAESGKKYKIIGLRNNNVWLETIPGSFTTTSRLEMINQWIADRGIHKETEE